MNCIICGSTAFKMIQVNHLPDKYESHMKISAVSRSWQRCKICGHYQQERNYPLEWLEKIYQKGYRSEEFRGKSVAEAFREIVGKSPDTSENYQRVSWVLNNLPDDKKTLLDIGSGLGIFAYEMQLSGYNVRCCEVNSLSIDFTNEELMIPCFENWENQDADVVSLIHFLEHIENPKEFLLKLKSVTDCVIIEVPDSISFKEKDKDHDDFNSCHIHMFSLTNLCRMVKEVGYVNYHAEKIHYETRGLDRIIMVAEC